MRILIVSSPGTGHLFPTVPTAWALRAAGHDVLVASAGNVGQAASAGLPVVDVAPDTDFREVFTKGMADVGASTAGKAGDVAPEDFVGRLFAKVSEPFVDRAVELARRWQPDLVIQTPLQGAGAITAASVDVPYVVHGISIGQTAELWNGVADQMAGTYRRLGLTPRAEAGVISVTPPGFGAPDSVGWPMRYTPYNSGAVLPEWLYEPRKRRRIAVTLGTVVPAMAGVGGLSTLVTEAGKVDADFVIALGDADPSGLGEVPDNVHLAGWIPLNSLAAVSDAAIHHGGAGTTMTVMTAGIPQIVLPHGADQFINAEQVVKAGIGMTVEPGELDAERIDTLLTDTGLRASAELVAGAIATQPTPAELVETIISVAR